MDAADRQQVGGRPRKEHLGTVLNVQCTYALAARVCSLVSSVKRVPRLLGEVVGSVHHVGVPRCRGGGFDQGSSPVSPVSLASLVGSWHMQCLSAIGQARYL